MYTVWNSSPHCNAAQGILIYQKRQQKQPFKENRTTRRCCTMSAACSSILYRHIEAIRDRCAGGIIRAVKKVGIMIVDRISSSFCFFHIYNVHLNGHIIYTRAILSSLSGFGWNHSKLR